jgi:histidinol-phosphate/aromatic aminotransferase/cobyric acid decarboxylase-like protein
LITPATRALVIIDPNNPTGASYSTETRLALLDFADRHGLPIIADEVYGDLGFEGSVPMIGSLDPDAPIITFSSLSKAYLAPGWRAGWMGIGRSPRLDEVVKAVSKLADARLCSTLPMQYAITAALTGDRSHQVSFRAALKERAAHHHRTAQCHSRRELRGANGCVLRDATGDAAAWQDRRGLRLRATARHGRAVRLRIRIRHSGRRRLLPNRVPGLPRRASGDLRPDGRFHQRVPSVTLQNGRIAGLQEVKERRAFRPFLSAILQFCNPAM